MFFKAIAFTRILSIFPEQCRVYPRIHQHHMSREGPERMMIPTTPIIITGNPNEGWIVGCAGGAAGVCVAMGVCAMVDITGAAAA